MFNKLVQVVRRCHYLEILKNILNLEFIIKILFANIKYISNTNTFIYIYKKYISNTNTFIYIYIYIKKNSKAGANCPMSSITNNSF